MRVERCFGFVDLCGFTAFTERFGDEYTVVVLANFRTALREIAARRGVRVTKWLGDGAMLSAVDAEAVVAMVMEVAARTDPEAVPLDVRGGLASGAVIMFEGDDYIGRATNVAARLCDLAAPTQVLATREVASQAPRWVAASETMPYTAAGFERPIDACRLEIGISDVMVTDAYCGLVLPEVTGLPTRFGADGSVWRFCSTACALAWEAGQRLPGQPPRRVLPGPERPGGAAATSGPPSPERPGGAAATSGPPSPERPGGAAATSGAPSPERPGDAAPTSGAPSPVQPVGSGPAQG